MMPSTEPKTPSAPAENLLKILFEWGQ